MFSWTFNDFDKISEDHLVEIETFYGRCLITSPIIATDPLNDTKYHATCRLQFGYQGDPDIVIEIWTKTRNKNIEMTFHFPDKRQLIKKLNIFLDVTTFSTKTFQRLPFHQPNKVKLNDEMKLMWKNDESAEFAIKCEAKTFKIAKPIMAARSPVFKKMFEAEMKEKFENFVEIKEFAPKIVEKMIEFCETDNIKDLEDSEDDLFKIAHLYQIQQLMYFAVEKMAENIKNEKIVEYIQLANLYDLHEFKDWCLQYAHRHGIDVNVN
uniref:BTB domain-containing protein n=1 Tax=Panagrolaimus davidi TaxID=227884 RepID=A0A914QSV1_9BILA